jgi:hypothetical protein
MLQKGEKGEQGTQGIQGIQGEQGIQGAQGSAGPAGANSVVPYFYNTRNGSLDTVHLCDYTIPAVFSSNQGDNGKWEHSSHIRRCNSDSTWTLETFAYNDTSVTDFTGEWVILNKSVYGHVQTLEKGNTDFWRHFPRNYSCDDYFVVITGFQQYDTADNMQAYPQPENLNTELIYLLRVNKSKGVPDESSHLFRLSQIIIDNSIKKLAPPPQMGQPAKPMT